MQPTRTLVAYYRVSTDKQGASGLGLEGQKTCVEAYAAATRARILASYQEVESGTKSDRPMLDKAIAHANCSGATLIIAKLDRLSRNVHFLSGLMESGVDFIACDNPNVNRLTVHILAAVAEDEAIRISERTKAAMAAYKARGGVLGTLANLTAAGRSKGQPLGTARV
jgi:DNA invertase Pin-like site-specific DNA recombinase